MHEFWSTQPMPENHRNGIGEIDSSRVYSETPLQLPVGLEWSTCSIDEVVTLLTSHYIGNDHFRLEYTRDFVEWATDPEWNIGVRNTSGELVAFISGVPSRYRIHETEISVIQINFLCIHTSLRNNKLTPILILEIRRRSNERGIWQAMATAVAKLPTPVTKTWYWHRLLNVRKLNKLKFSQERERPHVVMGTCYHRVMTEDDVPLVTDVLRKHMSTYAIAPVIDEEYVRRWLLPKNGIVYSYIDDNLHFTSYYSVPYISNKFNERIEQAYMFYDTDDGNLKSAVILARNAGFDVYNTLDVGLDPSVLSDSKFIKGNGHNHCYVYNWSCGDVPSDKIFMRFF